MMNYDKIFDQDVDRNFFYNEPGFRGRKLIVGVISINNAVERLKKDEYYTLVTYMDGEKLPEEYVPLDERLESGDLLATVNPKLNMQDIVRNGGIQMISKLSNGDEYLLGPGPDTSHQKNEYIYYSTIKKTEELYIKIIEFYNQKEN